MNISTENDNNFGYEKITILVDNIPLSWWGEGEGYDLKKNLVSILWKDNNFKHGTRKKYYVKITNAKKKSSTARQWEEKKFWKWEFFPEKMDPIVARPQFFSGFHFERTKFPVQK
jgi:hypothetical protein